jgi:hypothetical protein
MAPAKFRARFFLFADDRSQNDLGHERLSCRPRGSLVVALWTGTGNVTGANYVIDGGLFKTT